MFDHQIQQFHEHPWLWMSAMITATILYRFAKDLLNYWRGKT